MKDNIEINEAINALEEMQCEHAFSHGQMVVNQLIPKLIEILNVKAEQLSRREKMLFNSHWQCIVKHENEACLIHKNTKCYLGDLYIGQMGDEMIEFKTECDYVYEGARFTDYVEHFLLCFKPMEMENVHYDNLEDDADEQSD